LQINLILIFIIYHKRDITYYRIITYNYISLIRLWVKLLLENFSIKFCEYYRNSGENNIVPVKIVKIEETLYYIIIKYIYIVIVIYLYEVAWYVCERVKENLYTGIRVQYVTPVVYTYIL